MATVSAARVALHGNVFPGESRCAVHGSALRGDARREEGGDTRAQVGGPSQHPDGTHNDLKQLPLARYTPPTLPLARTSGLKSAVSLNSKQQTLHINFL